MAMEVATTDLYTCDGCGSIKHAMPGETVPGYSGTVVRTLPNGEQTDAPQAAERQLTRVRAEERQRIGEWLSRQLVAELTSPGNGSPADQAYDSAISAALSLVYAACDLPLNARIAAGSAVPVAGGVQSNG